MTNDLILALASVLNKAEWLSPSLSATVAIARYSSSLNPTFTRMSRDMSGGFLGGVADVGEDGRAKRFPPKLAFCKMLYSGAMLRRDWPYIVFPLTYLPLRDTEGFSHSCGVTAY